MSNDIGRDRSRRRGLERSRLCCKELCRNEQQESGRDRSRRRIQLRMNRTWPARSLGASKGVSSTPSRQGTPSHQVSTPPRQVLRMNMTWPPVSSAPSGRWGWCETSWLSWPSWTPWSSWSPCLRMNMTWPPVSSSSAAWSDPVRP